MSRSLITRLSIAGASAIGAVLLSVAPASAAPDSPDGMPTHSPCAQQPAGVSAQGCSHGFPHPWAQHP